MKRTLSIFLLAITVALSQSASSVTMVAGDGTGALTLPDWVEGFEVEISTDGIWNPGADIVITATSTTIEASDVWVVLYESGIQRKTAFQAYDGYLTVTVTNQTGGGAIPAGSRITRGMVWLIGEREN